MLDLFQHPLLLALTLYAIETQIYLELVYLPRANTVYIPEWFTG